MYSCEPLDMDEQRQNDQEEPIYNSSVPIQHVAWMTSQERWTIETGGKRGSGKSVLAERHDDDDDVDDWLTLLCNLRRFQTTLQERLFRYLVLWIDFCRRVWFQKVFLYF